MRAFALCLLAVLAGACGAKPAETPVTEAKTTAQAPAQTTAAVSPPPKAPDYRVKVDGELRKSVKKGRFGHLTPDQQHYARECKEGEVWLDLKRGAARWLPTTKRIRPIPGDKGLMFGADGEAVIVVGPEGEPRRAGRGSAWPSPSGGHLAIVGLDAIQFVEVPSLKPAFAVKLPAWGFDELAWHKQEKWVALSSMYGEIAVVDVASRAIIYKGKLPAGTITWGGDTFILREKMTNKARVIAGPTFKTAHALPPGLPVLSPDGSLVAHGVLRDRPPASPTFESVRVLDAKSGRAVAELRGFSSEAPFIEWVDTQVLSDGDSTFDARTGEKIGKAQPFKPPVRPIEVEQTDDGLMLRRRTDGGALHVRMVETDTQCGFVVHDDAHFDGDLAAAILSVVEGDGAGEAPVHRSGPAFEGRRSPGLLADFIRGSQ